MVKKNIPSLDNNLLFKTSNLVYKKRKGKKCEVNLLKINKTNFSQNFIQSAMAVNLYILLNQYKINQSDQGKMNDNNFHSSN